MARKVKVNLTIDKDLRVQAKQVLDEMGMNMSKYVSVVLRSLVDSQKMTFKQIYEQMSEDLIRGMRKAKKG